MLDEIGDVDEALSEKVDVEDIGSVVLFFRGEQVEQQRGDARLVEHRGDVAVSRTVTAAPAAVREQDQRSSVFGDGQVAAESLVPDLDLDVLVAWHGFIVPVSSSSGSGGVGGCRALEARDHFVVAGLAEVAIELADRRESLWGAHADQFVGHIGQTVGPIVRCHRDGENDTTGTRSSCDLTRSLGGRAGGDAVVDDDHNPSCQRNTRPAGPVAACTAFELGALTSLDVRQFVSCHSGHPDDVVVQYANAVLTNGPHAQLRLERNAEFADQDDVERSVQSERHLLGDRNTTPGQPDNNDVVVARLQHLSGELSTGVDSISEHAPHMARRQHVAEESKVRDRRSVVAFTCDGERLVGRRSATARPRVVVLYELPPTASETGWRERRRAAGEGRRESTWQIVVQTP